MDRVVSLGILSAAITSRLKALIPSSGLLIALAVLALSAAIPLPAAAEEAEAGPLPFKIGVLVTSRADRCYEPGDVPAIVSLATAARDRINATGGVQGRRLALEFLDDEGDAKKTIANVNATVADPQTLAMVGLTSSGRGKEVFDTAGKAIAASGMPWLSNISVNSIFADYPTVFTMRGAQEDDSIPVMAQFLKDKHVTRPAFVSIKDRIYSSALRDGMVKQLAPVTLVADLELALNDNKLEPAETAAMIDKLKQAAPDFLFLSIGSSRIAEVLPALQKAGVTPPIFVSGRLETIFGSGPIAYSGDLYQLAWDGLPDAFNDRLRQRLFHSNTEGLMFEGGRNTSAAGWASGDCKERPLRDAPHLLSAANLRAVGIGLQYSDMIGLIAQTLTDADSDADVPALRGRIVSELQRSFAAGHGIYPGESENWSFRLGSRAAARTPFIITRPQGLGATQLAPVQYVALRNDTMRQIQTLYLDVDLTRAFRIDDREKSFVAEFYLSLHGLKDESLDEIDFANAFLDPQTNNKQITIRPLHQGGPSDAYPPGVKIYAVSGKFMFQPNFGNYPFDTQRFSIDIRSKSGDAPFIIQPSPAKLRDQSVDAEGWRVKEQYVGYDEDFLPIIDAMSHQRSIVPFYKGSFVWVMKREATDYFLTVVVPLAFIMIIAYLAIFIPRGHFEAIVTIQVTALLSAVALYLTIPKVDSDEATVSDKIFLFDYMLISLMIGLSILRMNKGVARVPRLDSVLAAVHIVFIPVLVALLTLYVIGSSMSEGQTASSIVYAWRQALGAM